MRTRRSLLALALHECQLTNPRARGDENPHPNFIIERFLTAPRRIFGLSVPLKLTGHRGLAPPAGTRSPGSTGAYPVGGLQPALAVRRLSSAATPGLERDGASMRPRGHAGISLAAVSRIVVNFHRASPSPRAYGERVGVRGSRICRSKFLPLTLTLSPRSGGERECQRVSGTNHQHRRAITRTPAYDTDSTRMLLVVPAWPNGTPAITTMLSPRLA
jgi:hypothetical protein